MNNRLRILSAGISLMAVTAFAVTTQGFLLKRMPKEGDVFKYTVKAELEIQGTAATFTAKTTEKVLKVAADGTYEIESSQTDGKATFAGQEQDAPNGPPSVTVFKPGGEVVEIRGSDTTPASYRLANLNNMFEPAGEVKVGDSWTKEIKADAKTGTVDATAKYKLVGEEKLGSKTALKIEANYAEAAADGAKSDFTIWLDKADFTMLKTSGKWINVMMPQIPIPLNGSVEITRIEE